MLHQRLTCDVCLREINLKGGESRGQITHIQIENVTEGEPKTTTKNTHLCNRCMDRLQDYFSKLVTDINREKEQLERVTQKAKEVTEQVAQQILNEETTV